MTKPKAQTSACARIFMTLALALSPKLVLSAPDLVKFRLFDANAAAPDAKIELLMSLRPWVGMPAQVHQSTSRPFVTDCKESQPRVSTINEGISLGLEVLDDVPDRDGRLTLQLILQRTAISGVTTLRLARCDGINLQYATVDSASLATVVNLKPGETFAISAGQLSGWSLERLE